MRRHVHRAQEVTDGDPMLDESLKVGAFGRRIAGVQPLEVEELSVGGRKQPGVQGTEELRLPGRIGCEECLLARGVRRVHIPGELARRGGRGQRDARD